MGQNIFYLYFLAGTLKPGLGRWDARTRAMLDGFITGVTSELSVLEVY